MKSRAKPKRGRPPLSDERERRVNVTIRLTKQMKDRLTTDANAAGHSLSEEIEKSLERDRQRSDLTVESLGGQRSFEDLRLLGHLLSAALRRQEEAIKARPDLQKDLRHFAINAAIAAWKDIAHGIGPTPEGL